MSFARKDLIDNVKAAGYTGAEDAASVKSWMGSQGMDTATIELPDGTTKAFDEIWGNAPKLTLKAAPSGSSRTEPNTAAQPEIMVKGRWRENAKKAYANRYASGKALFADPDRAELNAVGIRLVTAGAKAYAQKEEDLKIWKEAVEGKAMSGLHNYLGGALIPDMFRAELIYMTESYGVARKLANVVPLVTDSTIYPRKTGIGAMAHRLANGDYALSDDNFDNVTLNPRDVGRLIKVNSNLFADSPLNVTDELTKSLVEGAQIREDQDYFNGDGTAAYGNQQGLISGLVAGAYINASGNAWSAVTPGDILKLPGSVENVRNDRLCYVSSRQFYVQVCLTRDIATSQFRNLVGGPIGNSDASFMGYPWYFSQVMATASASAQKCVYFGDFVGGSMLGVRQDIEVRTSEHFYFSTGDIAVRGSTRNCVNIHGDGRGSTFGPIVALVTT